MNRVWLFIGLAVLGSVGQAIGAEVKGTVRKVDPTGRSLTIEVAGANKSYDVAKDASIVRHEVNDQKKSAAIRVIEKGAAGIAVGSSVVFLTEDLAGKSVISSLKVTASPPAPKPAAPAKKKTNDPKKKSAAPKKGAKSK